MAYHNIAGMTSTTTGTGTLTLIAALTAHLSFADAGVVTGETVEYLIRDGVNTELTRGVYTLSGLTLTRGTVLNSTNGGAAISCSGNQQVYLTWSRNALAVGWMPYAYPMGYEISGTIATGLNLAAAGGTLLVPIPLPAPMAFVSVSVWNTDTASARTWDWDLYVHYANDELASQNALTRIIGSAGAETFTPSAASLRTIAASATTILSPGVVWLGVQNQHASNSFDIGAVAPNAFTPNLAQTKTTTNPNGATLDAVAVTWTKKTSAYCVRLNGEVFGQAVIF